MSSVLKHVSSLAQSRFDKKVEKSKGCWIWKGSKSRNGYGRFSLFAKEFYAHRASYEIHVGPIPSGFIVLHSCDNPTCVNPDHLKAGTTQDNIEDKVGKLRHNFGERHYASKLNKKDVLRIRKDYSEGQTLSLIAKSYGVSTGAIWLIVKRRNWKQVE